jgi:TolB protein
MKKTLLSVLVLIATLLGGHPASALVKINLTDANANPLPIALANLAGASEEEKAMGRQIKELIRNNLKNTGLFNPIDDKAFLQSEESLEKQGPVFSQWRLIDSQAVMLGSVEIVDDGSAEKKIRVVYRLFDVYSEEQITGRVYTATMKFWRHVGHRISDDIYKSLTGENGYFATRIVFIAEEPSSRGYKSKKLCVMDQDGGNYQCLTNGRHLVLTPRFSPTAQKVIYMSYESNQPRLYLLSLVSGEQEILGDFEGLNSSPRFSPDGNSVAMTLTMGHAGNPEIYSMDLRTRKLRRLTIHRGIDTSPSFSPDGKHIVFNSDRGGKPALYIMDKDGNNVHRLTYGEGKYYAPVWSPRGDLIAFVKQLNGRFSIGVIDPEGDEERLLTDSYMDESPSWSPNGRVIIFARQKGDQTRVYTIDLTGYNERQLPTPTDATDPSWSPLLQ